MSDTRLPAPAAVVLASLALLAAGCTEPVDTSRNTDNRVPVVTAEVELERISDRIEAIGTTQASDSVELMARVSNTVTAIEFEEGALVNKGDVLVRLESSNARANLAAARADLLDIRSQLARSEKLFDEQVVSQSQVEQQRAQVQAAEARVEAAEALLRDHTLRAPFDGRVGLRRVSLGTLVSPGDVLTTVDNVQRMRLDFAVPESYLAALESGQEIVARNVAYPDEAFAGKVETINTRIDPVTRTVTVRASLPNEEGRLRPGMFMTVILQKNPRDAIVIPELALVPEGSRKFVFIADGNEVIQREVTLGTRLPGQVEIVSGLEAGEEIVVEGTQSLRNGAEIRRVDAPGRKPSTEEDSGSEAAAEDEQA